MCSPLHSPLIASMSRYNESQEQEVPGDVKDAFDSLEKKLDAGLADLMADEGSRRRVIDDDDDDDNDIPSDSRAALAAADDGAREAEAMARKMAEEAASFAATAVTIAATVDNVSTSSSHQDLTEENKEQAQILQAGTSADASQIGKKDKSSKQISILVLGLVGLVLALGVGSIFHRRRVSNHLPKDEKKNDATLFDIVKDWNTKHEKEQRYNEAIRNMLNPKREESQVVEEPNVEQEGYDEAVNQQEQQYLIAGDGRMAYLINALYQPVYYVTYRPVQKLRYYYYHQAPSHQEEVVMRQSRGGGQTVTYRKARIVQNVHHR